MPGTVVVSGSSVSAYSISEAFVYDSLTIFQKSVALSQTRGMEGITTIWPRESGMLKTVVASEFFVSAWSSYQSLVYDSLTIFQKFVALS
ncbi:hypothetical protein KF707_21170 [Candidatus Obscuribacterales bacterium]|nr:hypothetical protein [Candidatus Obscuribacterales bacterium]